MPNNFSVANPGSALGEAVGSVIEERIHDILRPCAEAHHCVYITMGRENPKTGKPTKLLLKDNNGNKFDVDAVVATSDLKPLILVESKYLRYKKHNRDKASWICTAHYSLRRKFSSIRKSIAVLAGSWSKTSKQLLQSWQVDLFEIAFEDIVAALGEYHIRYHWEEKDRDLAAQAWAKWASLTPRQRKAFGKRLLQPIEPLLKKSLSDVLSNAKPREIKEVEIVTKTSLGEMKVHVFQSLQEAREFLEGLDVEKLLDHSGSPSIFE